MVRKKYTEEEKRQIKKDYNKKYREANKQRRKEYYEANKEKIKEKDKERYKANKEEILQYQKEYNQTPQGKKSITISHWKTQGMICDDFDSMYEIYIHTWNCDVCNKEFKSTKHRNLDHDHATGEIRGILCCSCNFKDVLKEE